MGTALFFLAGILSAAPPAPPRPTPAPPGTPSSRRPPVPPPVLQGVVKGPDARPVEKALVLVPEGGAAAMEIRLAERRPPPPR